MNREFFTVMQNTRDYEANNMNLHCVSKATFHPKGVDTMFMA